MKKDKKALFSQLTTRPRRQPKFKLCLFFDAGIKKPPAVLLLENPGGFRNHFFERKSTFIVWRTGIASWHQPTHTSFFLSFGYLESEILLIS